VLQRRWRASSAVAGLVVIVTSLAVPSSHAAGEPPAAHGRAGHISLSQGYVVRSGAGTAVAFFALTNEGDRPDVLLNELVAGLPVVGLWHRDSQVTADQLVDLVSCGGGPAAVNAELVHWLAIPLAAHRTVAVTPGSGQLELQLLPGVADVAITFDFDRAGPLTVSLPVRSGPAPVPWRTPA
jgi:copper(I)-binding protein